MGCGASEGVEYCFVPDLVSGSIDLVQIGSARCGTELS